ncbi:MAG: YeaC family protein [Oceanospirillales bacterium]|nr:YeaC family protein [Oceanospirillales bacterium]
MNFEKMIEAMTPDVYNALKRAVELGKWPNGERLSQEQRETSLRAVIAYEHMREMPDEQRVGFIDRTRPDGDQHGCDPLQPETLKILTEQ